jgi:hypothetical protein
MKKVKAISLLLVALACTMSCTWENPVEGSGYGALELRLGSGSAVRLETKTPADDLLDGLRFDNVLVVLTDNEDIVVGSVYKAYPYVPGVSDLQDAVAETSVTEDVIHFDHLLPGNYHVYAYANIDATQWQDSDNLISAKEKMVDPGDNFTPFLSRELLSLNSADTSVPGSPSTKMLLTGQKTIPVGLSVATGTVDLLRPVVRVKVTVKNNTPFPVTVDDLYFSGFNPNKAYLLDHRGSGSVPIVPGGVTYRKLPAYPILSANPSMVNANSEALVYQTLVYENASASPYTIYGDFTMDRSSETLSPLTLSLGGDAGSFDIITYSLLNTLPEGAHVDVLVINPRSATRSGRLYYGIGTANQLSWESCGYSAFNDMKDRASAIYNEATHFKYKGFSYTGFGNNDSGFLGWTGNTNEDPITPDAGDYYFDYTGAKSSYFKTIRKYKSGDVFYYKIEGLAVDPISSGDNSIENLQIEQGQIMGATNRYPSGLKNNDLIRFKNANGRYLKSNNAWGATTVDVAKVCKLTFENIAADNTTSDHQFILFGYYNPGNPGAPLKRMLKENNKEVPLTYMARNEDISIVINIYYADQEGSITFLVDNTTWDDDHSTTSSYTFK